MNKKFKTSSHQVISDWSGDDSSNQEIAEGIKFDLYVKARELRQITKSLNDILLLPPRERQSWLDDHEPMIMDLMNSFMDDSVLAMNGLQLDQESMNLSVELVTNLRDAMTKINSIFLGSKKQVS
jgi:hypothetical protein